MDKRYDISVLDQYLKTLIGTKADDELISSLQNAIGVATKLNSLDHEFIDTLKFVADYEKSNLYKAEKYQSIVGDINPSSTVIYFKTAGLFKVYESKDFDDNFLKRIRTNYKKGKEIYEVIDNNKPQKILVIIKSDNADEVSKIKKYIVQYAKNIYAITEDDLMTFKNEITGEIEIVINKFHVPNAQAKSEFILKLLQYITEKEKSTAISDKMKLSSVSAIDNTSMVLIPELKKLLDQHINKEVEGYISRPVIININIGNMQNITNAHVVQQGTIYNNSSKPDKFINHLRQTSPAWYIPDEVIEYDILYEEYRIIGSLSKKAFTTKYFNVLFKKDKRVTKDGKFVQLVKLLDYR